MDSYSLEIRYRTIFSLFQPTGPQSRASLGSSSTSHFIATSDEWLYLSLSQVRDYMEPTPIMTSPGKGIREGASVGTSIKVKQRTSPDNNRIIKNSRQTLQREIPLS